MNSRLLRGVAIAVVAVFIAGLAGCYESSSVNLTESSGEYDGKVDPLLSKLKTDDLRQQLRARFKRGQTER